MRGTRATTGEPGPSRLHRARHGRTVGPRVIHIRRIVEPSPRPSRRWPRCCRTSCTTAPRWLPRAACGLDRDELLASRARSAAGRARAVGRRGRRPHRGYRAARSLRQGERPASRRGAEAAGARSHRGRGIASRLMQAVEIYARRVGCTLLVLDTLSDSAAASVYRHLGWQYAGRFPLRRHARRRPARHVLFSTSCSTDRQQRSDRDERRLVSSGSTFERDIGYSRAVVDGEWVFVSGTTGFDYSTMTISDDVVQQAEQCLRNIAAALGRPARPCRRGAGDLPAAARRGLPACWPVLRRWSGRCGPRPP